MMYFLEFPQHLIGHLAFKYYTSRHHRPYYRYKDALVTHVPGRWGAISLSRYIFADDLYYRSDMIKHEYGHSLQSKKLLILYLFVIGLPSFLGMESPVSKIQKTKQYQLLRILHGILGESPGRL